MKQYYFSLSLSYKEFLLYYQGHIESIQVTSTQGITVRFPAMHLKPFIKPSGIHGFFLLTTENNKFKSIEQIN